ncbi:MAG: hypothetical protein O2887_05440 [Bacteroidetes bacterium]|nr:hypothetical protein [Bacteroidota bacterium]MDA1119925.1 hypothetical protein [Bacteroidota bacterium]
MVFRLFIWLFLFVSIEGYSQSLQWWADNVGWDGETHWSEYLIYSPKYTGPNAMPVPNISKGRIENITYLRIGANYYHRSGDQTFNPALYLNYNFLKERISVDLFMVPMELYSVSHRRKTERNVYYKFYDKKSAIGDVYINTNIQLLRQSQNKIDLALRIGLKTASSGLDNPARFIDSPGYYFDASIGKTFQLNDLSFRSFAMLGFYAWQTNDESLRQNDALLYGFGYEIEKKTWSFSQNLRGYSGYHHIGDKPVVMKISAEKQLGNKTFFFLNYQYGIRNFLYQGFELGIQINL